MAPIGIEGSTLHLSLRIGSKRPLSIFIPVELGRFSYIATPLFRPEMYPSIQDRNIFSIPCFSAELAVLKSRNVKTVSHEKLPSPKNKDSCAYNARALPKRRATNNSCAITPSLLSAHSVTNLSPFISFGLLVIDLLWRTRARANWRNLRCLDGWNRRRSKRANPR